MVESPPAAMLLPSGPAVRPREREQARNSGSRRDAIGAVATQSGRVRPSAAQQDRKSTRLNSSYLGISYAVFCLKKKKQQRRIRPEEGGTERVAARGEQAEIARPERDTHGGGVEPGTDALPVEQLGGARHPVEED